MPTGHNRYHEARYHRHVAGLSIFLIAEIDGLPVGSGEILWQVKEADVRHLFPDCPEINGLGVAAAWQSQGIGTMIIHTAEQLVVRRGRQRIGMGVADDNPRAASLYLRLGYRDTGHRYLDRYHYVDEQKADHEVAEPCRFLVKDLRPVPDPHASTGWS